MADDVKQAIENDEPEQQGSENKAARDTEQPSTKPEKS
jgi:hypothetical protein